MAYWREKVVVITGASAGLGLHLAEHANGKGASTVLVARDAGRLDQALSRFQSPSLVHAMPADVTAPEQVDQLASRVKSEFGRADMLINCAGKSARGSLLDTTPEDLQELMELNYLALARCTRAFLPMLLESRGHVVNIGSLAAKSASRFLGGYPSSKFAVAAYSQQLRLELSERGLHVLLVCPGPIARDDAGHRYAASDLPDQARKPGGGVRLKGIDPRWLSRRIFSCCESRKAELVVPAKARLLFAVSQISPRLGDWLVRKMTS